MEAGVQVVQPGFVDAVSELREFGFKEESCGVNVFAGGEEGFGEGGHGGGPGWGFVRVEGGWGGAVCVGGGDSYVGGVVVVVGLVVGRGKRGRSRNKSDIPQKIDSVAATRLRRLHALEGEAAAATGACGFARLIMVELQGAGDRVTVFESVWWLGGVAAGEVVRDVVDAHLVAGLSRCV